MDKKGVTLMEVVVSAVIFALVLVGMTNLFIGGRRYIMHARARMTAGELGKYFVDPLQMQVRFDQWGSNCLSSGAGCVTPTFNINNIDYNAQYQVSPGPGTTDVRRVTTTITWQEIAP